MNSQKQNLLNWIPFYVFFLAIYPTLFLWQANFNQIDWYVILRPLEFSLILTAIATLICIPIFRNARKTGAVAGLFLFFFLLYGHFYDLVQGRKLFGHLVGRHLIIFPLWGLLFLIGLFLILRSKSNLASLTWGLNLIFGFLVLFNLVQIGYASLNKAQATANRLAAPTSSQIASTTQVSAQDTPDVYYILSDAYDRQDMLESDVNFDNSAFITQLKALGFTIPNCTYSNYNNTITSMTATLNMDYLDHLVAPYTELYDMSISTYNKMQSLTLNNKVMQIFRSMGYKIVTMKSVFPFIDFKNSDVIFDVQSNSGATEKIASSNFHYLFLRTTIARMVIEEATASPALFKHVPDSLVRILDPQYNRLDDAYMETYEQNIYQLDKLETVAEIPGKKFVYAHLMATHPPFTFTRNGDIRLDMTTTDSNAAYVDQVIYADQRYLTIIKDILAQSKTPPIIILQGDHAYGWERKGINAFKIINAYYLPGNGKDFIYPSITPVNTFRILLTHYFGQNFPVIPDQSNWINPKFPNGNKVVPSTCVQ